ncbi:hypothetical protein TNCV_3119601 [Trichonephila clavipes]|uniref:Uncharacterized protein n=1 Tax=Trichonephila clavipes TaxID=2585209 RepID=A0A8X6W9J8_TRICX|nr:hypothetical protein TNCV_3119601 [Trichonephila clavipes]
MENIEMTVTDQLKAMPISELHQCYEERKKRLQRCVASEFHNNANSFERYLLLFSLDPETWLSLIGPPEYYCERFLDDGLFILTASFGVPIHPETFR